MKKETDKRPVLTNWRKGKRGLAYLLSLVLLIGLFGVYAPVGLAAGETPTQLNIGSGNIVISSTGASGGGLATPESELNPAGYHITGTTSTYSITVSRGVKTHLILEDVSISRADDCIKVSHTDTTITLIGNNTLSCSGNEGTALAKNGMDGSLVITCANADEPGHRCDASCGSLDVRGTAYHCGAIGNTVRDRATSGESGFCNLTIRGGNITAQAGDHSPGIGVACWSEYKVSGAIFKNVTISGGNIKAYGGNCCAGLGAGGFGSQIQGLTISGGNVYASGGKNSPGIGTGGGDTNDQEGSYDVTDFVISGGDTVVTAVGDQATNMPGIGSGRNYHGIMPGIMTNVVAAPEQGYQGFIQDGTSETDYNFTDKSPFSQTEDITVNKYFVMVYFSTYRDENSVDKNTNEWLGANNAIFKTGGAAFTEEQVKNLCSAEGRDNDGFPTPIDDILITQDELDAINEIKVNGKAGDLPLTFTTVSGTAVTVTISFRESGLDADNFDPSQPTTQIGANHAVSKTGGDPFTDRELKE